MSISRRLGALEARLSTGADRMTAAEIDEAAARFDALAIHVPRCPMPNGETLRRTLRAIPRGQASIQRALAGFTPIDWLL